MLISSIFFPTQIKRKLLSNVATLLSSFLLIWVGKKIDDINIFKFAFYVTLLLSFSCFFFSKISSIVFLFIAVFLMRFSGQGLMSHTATTTIARYFTKSRGKALPLDLVKYLAIVVVAVWDISP